MPNPMPSRRPPHRVMPLTLAVVLASCAGGGGAPGLAPAGLATPVATAAPSAASASPPPAGSASPAATALASVAPSATATSLPTASPTAAAMPGGRTPAPSPVPTVAIANGETPLAADALADSVGLNAQTPMFYAAGDFGTIVGRERDLGVRHLRDGILIGMSGYEMAIAQVLSATGARLDGIADCAGLANASSQTTSPADIQSFDAAIGGRMEAVEGPNEVDARGDAAWPVDTRACLPELRSAEPGLPFVAPSLADPNDDASTLGDVSADVDEGNVHRYFAGHAPGSLGWGGTGSCGVYGALSWALCLARVNGGAKPVVVTETGYNSETEVDEATQAKFLTRALLVNLQGGVARTYLYDVKDYTGGDAFGGDGLLRADDSPKPAYVAVEALIATFSDAGTATPHVPLFYALENPSLAHELFQKRDGTYVLALWNEAASWNTVTGSPNVIAPVAQTIDFELPPTFLTARRFDDTGALVASQTTAGGPTAKAGFTVTLPVDDHVTLVSFDL